MHGWTREEINASVCDVSYQCVDFLDLLSDFGDLLGPFLVRELHGGVISITSHEVGLKEWIWSPWKYTSYSLSSKRIILNSCCEWRYSFWDYRCVPFISIVLEGLIHHVLSLLILKVSSKILGGDILSKSFSFVSFFHSFHKPDHTCDRTYLLISASTWDLLLCSFVSPLDVFWGVKIYINLDDQEKFKVVVSRLRVIALQWWKNYKLNRRKKGKGRWGLGRSWGVSWWVLLAHPLICSNMFIC